MDDKKPEEASGAALAAWQLFCQTGLPEAYLVYAIEKECEEQP